MTHRSELFLLATGSHMLSPRTFLQLLWNSATALRSRPARQIAQIRNAMLDVLQTPRGTGAARLVHKIRFADDLEALWYLRQDLVLALTEREGDEKARHQMARINRLFKGGLPASMVPRAHHRIRT